MPTLSPQSAANAISSQEQNPLSQPPICTPVDQVVAPTDVPSSGPTTPKRRTVKRSRIQKPSHSNSHSRPALRTSSSSLLHLRQPGAATDSFNLNLNLNLDAIAPPPPPPPPLCFSSAAAVMPAAHPPPPPHHRPPLLPHHPLPLDEDSLQTSHTASQTLSQQQRDLPDFSQDTLALLPNLIKENQLHRSAHALLHTNNNNGILNNHSNSRPTSTNGRSDPNAMPSAPPLPAASPGLVRASLASALANSDPMPNPFLTSSRSLPTSAHVVAAHAMAPPPSTDNLRLNPPRRQARVPNASESFQDFDSVLDNAENSMSADQFTPLALGTPAVCGATSGPSDSSLYTRQQRSLKLVLVSGAQSRGKSLEFELHEVAGKGAFSEVTRATSRTDGCVYALKKNNAPLNSDKARLDALQEILALSALQGHANILRYHDAWFEDRGRYLLLQTEFLPSGNLHSLYTERNTPMQVEDLRLLAYDIASALVHMHARDIAHLDVKPDNIFKADRGLGRSSFVIGDFGLACHKDGKDARTTEGDSRYLCPEALGPSPEPPCDSVDSALMFSDSNTENAEPNAQPTRNVSQPGIDLRASDVFSLGASIYELAMGSPLDKAGPGWHRLRNRPDEVARDVARVHRSQALSDIVRRMIEPDPRLRARAAEIVQMCREADPASVEAKRRESELRREIAEQKARLRRFEQVMRSVLTQGEEGRKRLRSTSKTEHEYVATRTRTRTRQVR